MGDFNEATRDLQHSSEHRSLRLTEPEMADPGATELASLQATRNALVEEVQAAEKRLAEAKARGEAKLRDHLQIPETLLASTEPTGDEEAIEAWKNLPRDFDFPAVCQRTSQLCKDLEEVQQRMKSVQDAHQTAS